MHPRLLRTLGHLNGIALAFAAFAAFATDGRCQAVDVPPALDAPRTYVFQVAPDQTPESVVSVPLAGSLAGSLAGIRPAAGVSRFPVFTFAGTRYFGVAARPADRAGDRLRALRARIGQRGTEVHVFPVTGPVPGTAPTRPIPELPTPPDRVGDARFWHPLFVTSRETLHGFWVDERVGVPDSAAMGRELWYSAFDVTERSWAVPKRLLSADEIDWGPTNPSYPTALGSGRVAVAATTFPAAGSGASPSLSVVTVGPDGVTVAPIPMMGGLASITPLSTALLVAFAAANPNSGNNSLFAATVRPGGAGVEVSDLRLVLDAGSSPVIGTHLSATGGGTLDLIATHGADGNVFVPATLTWLTSQDGGVTWEVRGRLLFEQPEVARAVQVTAIEGGKLVTVFTRASEREDGSLVEAEVLQAVWSLEGVTPARNLFPGAWVEAFGVDPASGTTTALTIHNFSELLRTPSAGPADVEYRVVTRVR